MQAIPFPITHAGEDMGKPPTKTWVTELNRWAQALLVLTGMFAVGLPIERRLTTIEINQSVSAKADEKRAAADEKRAQEMQAFNENWVLLFRANAVQLEVMLKLRLPPTDRERVRQVLTEVKAKKISQADRSYDANHSDYQNQ
jgi:hypothetical protein